MRVSEPDLGHVNKRVTAEHNSILLAPFSLEEFTVAVNQMHPEISLGPDGYNPAFFQHYWQVTGPLIFHACTEWLNRGQFPNNLNESKIVLIPKVENPNSMKDFKPIALCNVLYKILAKVVRYHYCKIEQTE